MSQPVDADLEASRLKLPHDPGIGGVPRAEVERRPESQLLLEVGDLDGQPKALGVLDVVRQDQRSRVGAGPEPAKAQLLLPLCRQTAEGVEAEQSRNTQVHRPGGKLGHSLPVNEPSPSRQLQAAGNEAADSEKK